MPNRIPVVSPDADAAMSPDRRAAEALQRLEARLDRLERYVGLPALEAEEADRSEATVAAPRAAAPDLESEIGEFWLARVGVVALIVGLAFLVAYPFAHVPALVPSLIGYAAAAGLFGLARFLRRGMPGTADIVFNGAFFLLFFATLRLGFLGASPAISSRGVVLTLVAMVLAAHFFAAWRRAGEWSAVLAVVLVVATSIVTDTSTLSLALLLAASLVAVAGYVHRQWWRLLLATLVLVYGEHLLWLMGNPLAGHPVRGVTQPHFNLLFLALYGAAFIGAGLLRPQGDELPFLRIVRALGAGGGLLLLGLLNVRLFGSGGPPWVQLGLAVGFLTAATLYWQHHRGRYGTAIYACFGYLALSAAIMAWFPSPAVFSWLAWQSLLVAATAVWFQSKIIIVANLFICGGIYLAYLLLAPAAGVVNLSFAVVALLIARILNWQRDRLSLRTEFMRNVYLGAATVIIPYGLYHTVPKSLVSTAWLLAAGGYFLASLVLGSAKYRWMAMATIFATIGYVFVVDLSRLEPAYRIASFLVLGVGLIGFSIFYARQRTKAENSAAPSPADPRPMP